MKMQFLNLRKSYWMNTLRVPLRDKSPRVLYNCPQLHRDRSNWATFCHSLGAADGQTHFGKVIKQASTKILLNPDLSLEKDATIWVDNYLSRLF